MRSLLSFRKVSIFCRNVTYKQSDRCYSFKLQSTHREVVKEREENLNDLIKTELQQGASFTENQWNSLTEKLINKEIVVPDSYINPKNVSGVILRLCADFRLFDVGKAYFNLLRSKNEHNNVGILSRYLRLCSMNRTYALEHEDEVIGIYKQIKKSDVLEPLIGERCISAISLYEKHWKEAFDILEGIQATGNPSPLTFFSIAEACFRFGEVDRGWAILRTYAQRTPTRPSPECFLEYIKHCRRFRDEKKFKVDDIEVMFRFLEEFHYNLPSLAVVEELDKFIFSLSDDEFEWSLKETYIPKSAVCSSCRRLLDPVSISSGEFQELRQQFAKKAVVGKNIFLKSTPEEIENFRIFLAKALPYDIVIDGLNVAYSRGRTDPLSMSKTLRSVVAHFVHKEKKIVLLGRQHMKLWPKENMQYIFENAKVFLAKNLSQDDPLLLYAALKGGEKTFFISRDLMRSHLFALEDAPIKLLFQKWLISHQYMLGFFTKMGRPSILPPLPYRPTAQKLPLRDSQICWHLPYDTEYQMFPPNKREPSPRWLCIRKVPRKK